MPKTRTTSPGRPVVAGEAELPLDALHVGPSLRVEGLDARHVATLAELAGAWPPIVVRRDDRSVVDGQHRVAAARRLGLATLQVTWFDGMLLKVLEVARRDVSGYVNKLAIADVLKTYHTGACTCVVGAFQVRTKGAIGYRVRRFSQHVQACNGPVLRLTAS